MCYRSHISDNYARKERSIIPQADINNLTDKTAH